MLLHGWAVGEKMFLMLPVRREASPRTRPGRAKPMGPAGSPDRGERFLHIRNR